MTYEINLLTGLPLADSIRTTVVMLRPLSTSTTSKFYSLVEGSCIGCLIFCVYLVTADMVIIMDMGMGGIRPLQ